MKALLPLACLLTPGLSAIWNNGYALTRPFQEGESIPGTTEGILIMGTLIVLIIIVPIVWTRRKWMR